MLKHLRITNYALIQHIDIDVDGGLTVVTGDSGAGKSILLEALGLLLGSRANFSAIRKGEEKCSMEAVFAAKSSEISALLTANGLDEMAELTLRRELTTSGRSRAFVNDTPTNLNVLKELGRLTVDLHGQQENLALQSPDFQCTQLDIYAGHAALMAEYAQAFTAYKTTERKLNELRETAARVRKDQGYFQFQLEELNTLDFDAEKHRALEAELGQLENAGEIIRVLSAVSTALADDERGAINALRWAANEMKSVATLTPVLGDIAARLQSARIELEDLAAETERNSTGIEAGPARLEQVRGQLDEYSRLMHKHSVNSLDELLRTKEDYAQKLGSIASFDEELAQLEMACAKQLKAATALAEKLSTGRKAAVSSFSKAVQQCVRSLGMPKAGFGVEVSHTNTLHAQGLDKVQMRFDANGGALQPMDQVASGGEMARLMLALKSVQSASNEEITLIFDEIDTGVSGEVARRIGALMEALGKKTQVLAVTHLPGVAAKGHRHLKVYKEETKGGTSTNVRYLDRQARVEELAAMFSGEAVNEASLESARALLGSEN